MGGLEEEVGGRGEVEGVRVRWTADVFIVLCCSFPRHILSLEMLAVSADQAFRAWILFEVAMCMRQA